MQGEGMGSEGVVGETESERERKTEGSGKL